MDKTNIILFLTVILFSVSSCKKKKEKTKNEEIKAVKKIDSIKVKGTLNTPYLYTAKVNVKKGVNILKQNNQKGKIVEKIPFGTSVKIIAFTDKFESISVSNKNNVYGKWVEVQYQKNTNEIISGFIFDDYLDYQFKEEEYQNEIAKDTVTITNETEFLNALSSNRVIWIDTKTINIENIINNNNINEIDEYTENETYLLSDDYNKSLILYGYNNLEIRGKNRMVEIIVNSEHLDVLKFYSCSNILIDNVNFYHKEVGICMGAVTEFKDCQNFNFQNVHFDGSGEIGNVIYDSRNFNFLNCEYYNNNRYAAEINNSTNISFIRCDFHDNELYDVITNRSEESTVNLLDCYIKNNKGSSVMVLEKSSSNKNRNYTINIKNSVIEHNELSDNIINLSDSNPFELNLSNCKIKNNISLDNKYLFDNDKNTDTNINLNNVVIEENTDFYDLFFVSKENITLRNTRDKNTYNQATDSLQTKFNTYKEDGITMTSREEKNLVYNNETRQLSRKKHILEGMHRIVFSREKNSFFGYPVAFTGSIFVGVGNIVDGRLDGKWIIKPENGLKIKYILSYEEGFLNGPFEFQVITKTNGKYAFKTIQKGIYTNGKKEGMWHYYFKNGNKQKSVFYNKGEMIAPFLYYFPSGILREERTDLNNLEGKTTYYYPSGEQESAITYENGKIQLDKSTFIDINGKKKKGIFVNVDTLQGENRNSTNEINYQSKKHKNNVHIYYSKTKDKLLGYTFYKEGKPYSVSRTFVGKNILTYNKIDVETKKDDILTTYYNKEDSSKQDTVLIYNNQNNIKYTFYESKSDTTETHSNQNYIININTYGGTYNFILKENKYKMSKNSRPIFYGKQKMYYDHGILKNR